MHFGDLLWLACKFSGVAVYVPKCAGFDMFLNWDDSPAISQLHFVDVGPRWMHQTCSSRRWSKSSRERMSPDSTLCSFEYGIQDQSGAIHHTLPCSHATGTPSPCSAL